MHCQVLDENANRCRRAATCWVKYHGGELYSALEDQPAWVKVAMCGEHAAKAHGGDPIKKRPTMVEERRRR